jgi:hypothetical protein
MRKVRSWRCVSCIEELVLAGRLVFVSSVIVVMGPVVVDTRAEEAPVQKKLENGRMQGGKGAWKEALWRAEKDKHASSVTGPEQAHTRRATHYLRRHCIHDVVAQYLGPSEKTLTRSGWREVMNASGSGSMWTCLFKTLGHHARNACGTRYAWERK